MRSATKKMGWERSRLLVVVGAIALVLASCGGGGNESPSATNGGATSDATLRSGEDSGAPAELPADQENGASSEQEAPGVRTAVITIDGEATSYALDDLTYSNVDGVEDLTFETCNPDFFGSGRFYAIGYAVDGEILVGDDGQPVGTFTMDLPPDDWEAAQRDAPQFDITVNGLDIEMASPEEAAGETMAWTIDDTSVSGSAVFVDFENTYTVDFEVVCEGSPTVNVDDLPADDDGESDAGGGGGFPLAGAGKGSFTADGESFDNVDVYSCEPFSFGSEGPDPNDISLLAYLGGTSGLEVELSHSQGYDFTDGSQFDQINLNVFHSRQGANGLEQFEGSAVNDAAGAWYLNDRETGEQTELGDPPLVRDDTRITGGVAGLVQTWPDEGAAVVDVTFDLEIPTEVNEEC